MTYYLKSGTTFKVTRKEDLDVHERLPVGTYTVGVTPCGEFFLQIIDGFVVSGKLYGNTTRHAERVLNTFTDRSGSTGVLLAGEKGSGKTLLAKYISIKAAQDGIPTIVINKNWHGEQFNAFLQKIEQPTIILFDEYEKVYNDHQEQEKMLTLLDGVYPSKKLFLLTCNDKWHVNENMRNRPGRIFYMLDFNGLDADFVREYCEDNLNQKKHIHAVCVISTLFSAFNFDMLKGLVEDMNRYNESPSEVLRFLNVRPEFSGNSRYAVKLEVDGAKREDILNGQTEWHGNPIKQDIHLSYPHTGEEGSIMMNKAVKFDVRHLQSLDARANTYTFADEEKGSRLTLTPLKTSLSINYDALASATVKDSMKKVLSPLNGQGGGDGVFTLDDNPADYY